MHLPETLLQEIQDKDVQDVIHPRRTRTQRQSRKDERKQERTDRKKRKAEFYRGKKRPWDNSDSTDPPKHKKVKFRASEESRDGRRIDKAPAATTATTKKSEKAAVPEKFRTKALLAITPRQKSQIEEREDAYISFLEDKLGYATGKKKHVNPDYTDGLEDLLNFADSLFPSNNSGNTEDEVSLPELGRENSEDNDDKGYSIAGHGDVSEGEESVSEEDEWHGIEVSSDKHELADISKPTQLEPMPTTTFSRPTLYIPPSLRNSSSSGKQDPVSDLRLTKKLKGLLNRMSEHNLATILDEIEGLYSNHRRHDVTSTLTKLIIDGIISYPSLLDSFVALHATLVASLHRLIGVEFAAFFVQVLVYDYETHYHAFQAQDQATNTNVTMGKECTNLIMLISELYNFQVIGSILIYDIIRTLLRGDISEMDAELLLKLLGNTGQQLRQDDPSALKDIVVIVQGKVADKEGSLSSRARFMIETLTNLKNNKLRRNFTQNQAAEAVERMKKFLSGLAKKHHVLGHEALRVSLNDLHSAETKGKWWLVGAAWTGDPLADREDMEIKQPNNSNYDSTNNQLLALAKKQGMNTDIRRGIFLVIMSSEDYVDACDRLSQLSLTEVQQREIVRVLLHCCGNEKTYNPYYTLVCQHLCRTTHAHRITLQFCLWDFFRDLGETSVGGVGVINNRKEDYSEVKLSNARIRNVAKAYGWLIAKDSVTLGILKPVDFTCLKSQGREFLRELLINVIISSQAASPVLDTKAEYVLTTRNRAAVEEIFIKATRVETLAMGLVYFMADGFQDASLNNEGLWKLIKWGTSVAKDTLTTSLDVVPTL
ncbi:hypothetical protein AMATHDRAFT_73766 [Amanita thiersii Skay4041]|uniref:MI domain-containing protein n=1 Tax=Amanita thiersii Skay4041 TaxID=703135 RepID=A0A2A9NU92_9AGAR|nr:hypothetical protein AMATHDRAFT_73766 [Amanita thiersii Skay4041]